MNIIKAMADMSRTNLRTQMHKVAAAMVKKSGVPLANDEITTKEAAYIIGRNFWLNHLEKRAMLDGIMSLRQLQRK